MSSAELNKKKLDLIAWINQLSDINLILFLDSVRNSRTGDDWWKDLSEAEKKIIMQGLEEAEKGNLISSNEFWNKLKNA